MLFRLFFSIIVFAVNAVSWLAGRVRARRDASNAGVATASQAHREEIRLGHEIAMDDVSAHPVLGAPVWLPVTDMLSHMWIPSRTGSGKTSLLLLLVSACIRLRITCAIVDAKGDLLERLLPRFAQFGDAAFWTGRLTILDLLSDWALALNFFALGGDPYAIAGSLYASIEALIPGGFGVTIAEGMRAALLALAMGRGQWTILHLEPLLTVRAFSDKVLEGIDDPFVVGFFTRFWSMGADQRAALVAAIMNKLVKWTSAPQFRRMTGQKRCAPFRKLADSKGHVFVLKLGTSALPGTAEMLGGIAVTGLIDAVFSRATDTVEGKRNSVVLFCDECHGYAVPAFNNVIQEGRRMGIGIALFHQTVLQLLSALADLIMNNAKTLILFGCGAKDASILSREIGGEEAWDARTILTRQAVGQAYFCSRGKEPKRLVVDFEPDPQVDPAVVDAIRQVGLSAYARPAAEVDAEIAAELAAIRAMGAAAATGASSNSEVPDAANVAVRPVQDGGQKRRKGH